MVRLNHSSLAACQALDPQTSSNNGQRPLRNCPDVERLPSQSFPKWRSHFVVGTWSMKCDHVPTATRAADTCATAPP